MKKIALILLGVFIFVIVISLVLKAGEKKIVLPTIDKAQYTVKADDRYFYTNLYDIKTDRVYGQYLLLHGYWDTTNGKDWVYHPMDLKLSYRAFNTLAVVKRVPVPTP